MNVNQYFESIKGNKAKLQQFFARMPKGGDLHNHLTGSVYAETYFEFACEKGLYADLDKGKLYSKNDPDIPKGAVLLDKNMKDLHNTRMTLIDKWSVRNYQPYKCALGPDEYFFGEFGLFSKLADYKDLLPRMLRDLKIRAKKENVQYLEVMSLSPSIPEYAFLDKADYEKYTEQIQGEYNNPDGPDYGKLEVIVSNIIESYKALLKDGTALSNCILQFVNDNNSIVEESHENGIVATYPDLKEKSENQVTVKLQGYASRGSKDPIKVLAQLFIVYNAIIHESNRSLVGCNIVAAENSEYSMVYYKLHMIMFKVLNEKITTSQNGEINKSIHAGELTIGLIRPEHLTYHISEAIEIAKPNRVGHGVDLPFENSTTILKKMVENQTAIEINLTSNKFILGVQDDAHPFKIYKDNGVPIIISTDDPGILRTSLTEEYTEVAYRYQLSYQEIREIVKNSIRFSFLPENEKSKEENKLENTLKTFEEEFGKKVPVKEVTLPEIKSGMFMQYFLTTQAGDSHTITLKDDVKIYFSKETEYTGSRQFRIEEKGGNKVKGNNLTITLEKECLPIVTMSELCDGPIKKGVTYTVVFEDQMQGDNDYNDICVSVIAWNHAD